MVFADCIVSNKELAELNVWYQQPLGINVALAVKQQLDQQLSKLPGKWMLQMGLEEQQQWLATTSITHRLIVSSNMDINSDIFCESFTRLPIENDSIDSVFLPHTVELCGNLRQMLTEMQRILTAEGRLIIVGFNPFSLWGMRRRLRGFSRKMPWVTHFVSPMKLKKILGILNFQLLHASYFMYRPPLQRLFKYLAFLERVGPFAYPGGMYIIVAKKQEMGCLPVGGEERTKNYFINKQFVQTNAQVRDY